MKEIKTISGTLIVVPVEEKAQDFELHPPEPGEDFQSISHWYPIDEKMGGKEPTASVICLPKGKYELLGFVTPSEISFDAHPYLPSDKVFMQILNENGVYFENPHGLDLMPEAQSKVISKCVILLKK